MPCRGFTVVELALLIAVTAIVVTMGYSAWKTHVVRGQVVEGAAAARATQDAVARAFHDSGEVPITVPIGKPGPFVASVSVENGRVDLIYGGQADGAIAGRRLSLTPYETAAPEIVWLCGNEIPGPGLNPLGFSGGGRQPQQISTTIETRYLPRNCR